MTGNVTRYGKGVRNVTNMNRHALVFIYKQEHYDTRFSFANRNTDFSFIKKNKAKKPALFFICYYRRFSLKTYYLLDSVSILYLLGIKPINFTQYVATVSAVPRILKMTSQ